MMSGLTQRFLSLYALLPVVLTGWYAAQHAFPVPMYDEWVIIQPLVISASDGTLTLQALTQVYFGHRQFTSYFITVILALLTGWDTRIDIAFNFALALASTGLILSLFRRSGLLGGSARFVVVLAITLLLFTPVQFINFIYGNAKCTWLLLIAVYGSAWMLTRPITRQTWLILVGLALFASWSFLSGHLLWLIVPLLLWLRGERRRWMYLGWFAIAGLQTALYFGPGYALALPDAAALSFNPADWPARVLIFLGGPFSAHPRADAPLLLQSPAIAGLAGTIGLLTVVFLSIAGSRARQPIERLLPWYLLIGVSLGSGLMIAIGRAATSVDVISSRFVSLAVPFWIGAIGLSLSLNAALRPRQRAPLQAAAFVVLPGLAALLLLGVYRFYHVDPLPARAVACVRDYQSDCHQILLGNALSAWMPEHRLAGAVNAVRTHELSIFVDFP